MISFTRAVISGAEYNRLRAYCGWRSIPEADVEDALRKSLVTFRVDSDGDLIGFARIIGDGIINIYIQDMIVHPDHRRRGIANQLVSACLQWASEEAPNAAIGLMAAKGVEPLYAQHGFIARPNDRMGAGMVMFPYMSESELRDWSGDEVE